VVALLFIAPSCFAQLTQEQKLTDFKALAGLYDKNYGPYEWKKEVFGFDLLQLRFQQRSRVLRCLRALRRELA
jgi:hypothetical protein